ncbi:MAG: hypothetical protein ACFFAS_07435 [Promethearchaeota archaeon]
MQIESNERAIKSFKKGNYEFHSIKTEIDALKAINGDKSIIFQQNKILSILFFIIGILILAIGYLAGFIYAVVIYPGMELGSYYIIMSFAVSGLWFLAILTRRNKFVVFSPKGLFIKYGFKKPKLFEWEDIQYHIYEYTVVNMFHQIRHGGKNTIFMTCEGIFLEFDPQAYKLKEFTKEFRNRTELFPLVWKTVLLYLNHYIPSKKTINLLSQKTTHDQASLMKACENYKKNKHHLLEPATKSRIIDAFLNDELFIFKGKVHRFVKIMIGCFWLTSFLLLFLFITTSHEAFWGDDILLKIYFIIVSIIFFVAPLLFLYKIRGRYLVIGPNGVYRRKGPRSHYIEWKHVTLIEHTVYYRHASFIINLFEKSKGLFTVRPIHYNTKQLTRNKRSKIFMMLLQTYWELARASHSPS